MLAVAGSNELYATQLGPQPINTSAPRVNDHYLWRCTWDEADVRADGTLPASCLHGYPLRSTGLNGINISPDHSRMWINDQYNGQLWVFDRAPDGSLTKLPDVWLPGMIDNVERDHGSGDLTMGMIYLKHPQNESALQGGNIVQRSLGGPATSRFAPPTVPLQISTLIQEYQVSTSLVYGQWTVLGSPWDTGLMICGG